MKYIQQFVDDSAYQTLISTDWYKELQTLMKSVNQSTESIPNMPILVMTGERDKITDTKAAADWLKKQELSEYQFKEWKNCFHDFIKSQNEKKFLLIPILSSIMYLDL